MTFIPNGNPDVFANDLPFMSCCPTKAAACVEHRISSPSILIISLILYVSAHCNCRKGIFEFDPKKTLTLGYLLKTDSNSLFTSLVEVTIKMLTSLLSISFANAQVYL